MWKEEEGKKWGLRGWPRLCAWGDWTRSCSSRTCWRAFSRTPPGACRRRRWIAYLTDPGDYWLSRSPTGAWQLEVWRSVETKKGKRCKTNCRGLENSKEQSATSDVPSTTARTSDTMTGAWIPVFLGFASPSSFFSFGPRFLMGRAGFAAPLFLVRGLSSSSWSRLAYSSSVSPGWAEREIKKEKR